tara:strand:+ start:203 stop:481 length:279 start_codon:yes stop_codon:yes gene_type:complete
MKPERLIFTITAGRTGTAWLTSFIKDNSSFLSIHEYVGIDDFGSRMPDIRTMRTFNEIGLTEHVKNSGIESSSLSKKYSIMQNLTILLVSVD